jgi:protein SCO1/2
MKSLTPGIVLAAALFSWAGSPAAHQGEDHTGNDVVTVDTQSKLTLPETFPVDLSGPFNLIDHNGVPRSERDFEGKHLLIFFGYAHCKSMCTVGLRRIGEALDSLGDTGKDIQPIMITVDPDNDTQEVMKQALAEIHPRLLGLTGSKDALAQAYRAFHIKPTEVGEDPEGDMVINHTSYVYLMSPHGEFLTLMPPILSGERMGEIIANYIS